MPLERRNPGNKAVYDPGVFTTPGSWSSIPADQDTAAAFMALWGSLPAILGSMRPVQTFVPQSGKSQQTAPSRPSEAASLPDLSKEELKRLDALLKPLGGLKSVSGYKPKSPEDSSAFLRFLNNKIDAAKALSSTKPDIAGAKPPGVAVKVETRKVLPTKDIEGIKWLAQYTSLDGLQQAYPDVDRITLMRIYNEVHR